MELLEESLGLLDHIHNLRTAFQPEDDEQSMADHTLVEKALMHLAEDRQVATRILERLAHDVHFMREQAANLFNNEVVLWREPENDFSLRMFIWTPDCDNWIHDHNAWGMLACWWGQVLVENYVLLNQEAVEEKAELQLKEKLLLRQGQTALVRPLNEGIHRVDRASGDIALSVSVYSRRITDRPYVLRYDQASEKAFKVYHRSRRRREWAKQLLGKINP